VRDELDDIVVREATPADAPGIARVYVDTWRRTYAGVLPASYLHGLSIERLTRFWRGLLRDDPRSVVVATSGDVIAFSSGGRERDADLFFRGEIFTLYVTPSAQHRGVGTQLFITMLRRLADAEHTPVLVWVLEKNEGARRFYETLGGVPVRSRPEKVGGVLVDKLAYAWFDL